MNIFDYQSSGAVFVKLGSLGVNDFRFFHTWVEYYVPTEISDLGLADSFIEKQFFEPSNNEIDVYFTLTENEQFHREKEFVYSGLTIKFGKILLEGWGFFVCGALTSISACFGENVSDLFLEKKSNTPSIYIPNSDLKEDTISFQQEMRKISEEDCSIIEIFPHNGSIMPPSRILFERVF